jgi:hypothetical protein
MPKMNANNGEDELPLTRQWIEDFKRWGHGPEAGGGGGASGESGLLRAMAQG